MRVLSVLAALGLCGALTLVSPAAHAVDPQAVSVGVRQLSQQDRVFLERSHQNNLTEIIAGDLAVKKGECPQVRELGAMLITHHLALDAEVTAVATRYGVPLPQAPSAEQAAELSDLAWRSGRDFDMAWLRFAIITHVQALALGEQEILLGQQPDVKQVAVKAQPVLRHHLEQAVAAWEKCAQSG